jgi:hypothetical protein
MDHSAIVRKEKLEAGNTLSNVKMKIKFLTQVKGKH